MTQGAAVKAVTLLVLARRDCVEGDTLVKVSGRGPKAISSEALSPFYLLLTILSDSPPSARCPVVLLGWKDTGIAVPACFFIRSSHLEVPAKVLKGNSNTTAFLARWYAEKGNININTHQKLRAPLSCIMGNETVWGSREEPTDGINLHVWLLKIYFVSVNKGLIDPHLLLVITVGNYCLWGNENTRRAFGIEKSVQSSFTGWNVLYSSQIFVLRLKFPSGQLLYFRYIKYLNVWSSVIFNGCPILNSFQSHSLRENSIIWLLLKSRLYSRYYLTSWFKVVNSLGSKMILLWLLIWSFLISLN